MKNNRTFGSNRFWLLAATIFILQTAVFAGTPRSDTITLNMEGSSTATVPKGNTVNRRIFNIPQGIPGRLVLKLKWHALSIIPNTFNALRISLKHDTSTIIAETSCFSVHSDKTPKCSFSRDISQAEANRGGNWTLTVTNNSNEEVTGFDIEKGSDINPLVPTFRSVYTPDCPSTVVLDMEGTTLTLTKGNTQERKISGIGVANGDVVLKMKWHAVNIIPNTFNALKVDVMNGSSVVASSTCFSVHSDKSPKCSFTFDSGNRPPDQWKLRITNNSNDEVTGFDIRKGSDINPLVPSFVSTYKAKCQ
jgi:hypothetical protein